MTTIRQQIEIVADPGLVGSTWEQFVRWAHTGSGRLACDEIACVDAIRSGLVEFIPSREGATVVIFSVEEAEYGPSRDELSAELVHDLVVFKDYVERSGLAQRRPSVAEAAAIRVESGRRGDAPRLVRLSDESDSTFWQSHFRTAA